MAQLLDERDLGVLTSSMSLLVALVSNNHEAYWSSLPKCVKILERLARNQDVPQEYTYYGIPSPWLQVSNFFSLPDSLHVLITDELLIIFAHLFFTLDKNRTVFDPSRTVGSNGCSSFGMTNYERLCISWF